MTTLASWMERFERDDRWLAEALGCDRSQASRIRRGRSRPSAERAYQIERLTRGKVKASELLTASIAANDPTTQSEAA